MKFSTEVEFSPTKMDHCFVKGYKGGTLLYLKEEKNLFVRKSGQEGEDVFICYQTILAKNKKKKPMELNCTARVKLNANTICKRNKIAHSNHGNHEIHFRDLESLNAIKKNCRLLQKIMPITAHKVSAKELFLQEMAKYVFLTVVVY